VIHALEVRFSRRGGYKSTFTFTFTVTCLAVPQGVSPSEFREDLDIHKTRMNVISCGEENMTICSAVLIQYQRATDGRTDRHRRPAYS